jgi:hypothetical protein
MNVPPQAIEELQKLWQMHFGKEISKTDATLAASHIIKILHFLSKPPPS